MRVCNAEPRVKRLGWRIVLCCISRTPCWPTRFPIVRFVSFGVDNSFKVAMLSESSSIVIDSRSGWFNSSVESVVMEDEPIERVRNRLASICHGRFEQVYSEKEPDPIARHSFQWKECLEGEHGSWWMPSGESELLLIASGYSPLDPYGEWTTIRDRVNSVRSTRFSPSKWIEVSVGMESISNEDTCLKAPFWMVTVSREVRSLESTGRASIRFWLWNTTVWRFWKALLGTVMFFHSAPTKCSTLKEPHIAKDPRSISSTTKRMRNLQLRA